MKNIIYTVIIAILLATTVFYWHRSRELSYRLALIQQRIEKAKSAKVAEQATKERLEQPSCKARVAIVLDDFGYNMNNLKAVWDLDIPITLSILPNLPYSKAIAKAAKEKKAEVMLHLPLEPDEHLRLESDTIMTAMSDDEIGVKLEKAISCVPNLRGISNHMGSKATEDRRVMSTIYKRMKKSNLYFLDSLVTNKSVCKDLAGEMNIKFASRSVFLDNELDKAYIEDQLMELAKKALSTDWAIGIGHDRGLTISTIKETIPALQKLGIEFVFVSDIVE